MSPAAESRLATLRPDISVAVRPALLEPLERTAGWLWSLADGEGRLICPEHRVEHTGKSACAAILFAYLWAHGCGERWLERAIAQGRRLVANLEREGTSPCHTFRPGRHDPFNCSNSVIDGGACSDALASLVAIAGDRLSGDDARAFTDASLLHARTYLRYAVLDKGVPAQRAWGLTGLAGAHALEADEVLADAAAQAVGILEGIQNGDGSYPYHPREWGAGHPGAADVSSFYQSRVTGFLLHALAVLGRDPSAGLFHVPLRRGLEFLAALVGPDGIKPGLVEAKPWYWGAEYEVASHVFDVHALAVGSRVFKNPRFGELALRSYGAWAEHLDANGAPRSHLAAPGRRRSYQCPVFWAAHACWIARALPDLERALDARPDLAWPPVPERGADWNLSVWTFESAQLARLDDGNVCAFVRGARPEGNVNHGAPLGAGLVRVVSRADERSNTIAPHAGWIDRRPFRGPGIRTPYDEGEWVARAGRFAPRRGWSSGKPELRFSLWQARVARRAGRPLAALGTPFDVLRRGVLDFASSRVSTAYEREPTLHVLPDGVAVRARLCHRDGDPVAGCEVLREFRLCGDGVAIEEQLTERGAVRSLRYRVPARAQYPGGPLQAGVIRDPDLVRYSLG